MATRLAYLQVLSELKKLFALMQGGEDMCQTVIIFGRASESRGKDEGIQRSSAEAILPNVPAALQATYESLSFNFAEIDQALVALQAVADAAGDESVSYLQEAAKGLVPSSTLDATFDSLFSNLASIDVGAEALEMHGERKKREHGIATKRYKPYKMEEP